MGVFDPIYATERLHRTPTDHAAQVLNTWSAGGKLVQAAIMVIWGVLATLTSPLTAIIWSGLFLFATPHLNCRNLLPDIRLCHNGFSY
ncbi:hypothetical protein R3P93_23240 [Rhodococcus cerastii]|uniref:Uncharacterized protein n=1 Tax=Rhodococcus cerastii TaxID=908616 RepID=A0ABU4D8Q1_9NOCA|nr:hypothetical protein [Rhodococcus cerastii]MDV6305491.1 hypothetical protein [Rhodococcus cerastii]